MKVISQSVFSKWRAWGRRAALVLGGGALAVGVSAPVQAEQVDAELVILVDTSVVVSATNFDALLEGFATAVESNSFTTALESASGRGVAASLVFFGGAGVATTAVPWMRIDDAASAQVFANLIRGAVRPAPSLFVSFSDGLGYATEQFGTETGFAGNGFESDVQAINLTTETFLIPGEGGAAVAAASQAALDAGVDVINGITVGTFNAAGATAYYEANIVGGEANGVPGGVSNAPNYAQLPALATGSLTGQLLSIVPEPSGVSLVLLGVGLLTLKRRRG